MDPERVHVQLERILSSSSFADADRARRFLQFVVRHALNGRAAEIKEYVIGTEVLGRNAGFDPKTDPIVRVEASRLRNRLESYYLTEGNADPVLITIPKGGYIPEFTARKPSAPPSRNRKPWLLVASGALLGAAVALTVPAILRKPAASTDILKFSILPPSGADIQFAVISPDGRQIAYTAVSEGKNRILVRALDSLEAKPVPGAELSAYPFWSPDSRSLGYFSTNKLMRAELSGGPAQAICDARVPRGASWSPAGVIVFPPRPRGILYQVAASGGTPKPATALDQARGEVAHSFPHFLPDRRHFLFLATGSRPGESWIRVGSIDSRESKFLMNAHASAEYAPASAGQPGYLLFGHGGALMAQPFDPERLELSGGRVLVAPELLHSRGRAHFSIARTGVLIYRAGNGKDRQLTWIDRYGKVLTTVGPVNNYSSWSLSPDEKYVVFQETSPSGEPYQSIALLDLARGASALLTQGFEVFLPVWSPDSRRILFSRGDDMRMTLELQNVNEEKATTWFDSPSAKFPTDWSSDGRSVAYFTVHPDFSGLQMWIVDVDEDGRAAKAQPFSSTPHGEEAYFSPAPPGQSPRWIAHTFYEAAREEVFLRSFPDGNSRWRVSTDGGWQPRWRRDGRELYYLAPDGMLMAVEVKEGTTPPVASPRPLFETRVRNRVSFPEVFAQDYAPAADGQRFLVNRRISDAPTPPITVVSPWRP